MSESLTEAFQSFKDYSNVLKDVVEGGPESTRETPGGKTLNSIQKEIAERVQQGFAGSGITPANAEMAVVAKMTTVALSGVTMSELTPGTLIQDTTVGCTLEVVEESGANKFLYKGATFATSAELTSWENTLAGRLANGQQVLIGPGASNKLLTAGKGLSEFGTTEEKETALANINGVPNTKFILTGTRLQIGEWNFVDPEIGFSVVVLGGRHTTDPNKVGFNGKPDKTDFTPPGWVDDTAYPAGGAAVATIGGGYDHVNNQLAGTIGGGGHNFLRYHVNGHSTIGGGSYNIVAGGRGGVFTGRANSVGPTGNFGLIVQGDQNATNAEHATVLNGVGNQVNGNRSLAFGRNITVEQPDSFAFGDNLLLTAPLASIQGAQGIGFAQNSKTLSKYRLTIDGDQQRFEFIIGARTTNDTLANLQSAVVLPVGKKISGVATAKITAMRDGSPAGNNDGNYAIASFISEVGFFWDGTNGIFHDDAGEVTGTNPQLASKVIRDNITVVQAPTWRINTGQFRMSVQGVAGVVIKWSGAIDVVMTLAD